MNDRIPTVEIYRGVPIHDQQTQERIERRVKPQIDYVFDLEDIRALTNYAGDVARPPEARLLAGVKLLAMYGIAVDERRIRPDIDPDYIQALIAGLDSVAWRSPWYYGNLVDDFTPGGPGPEPREEPWRLRLAGIH